MGPPCDVEVPKSAAAPDFKKAAKAGQSWYQYGASRIASMARPGLANATAIHRAFLIHIIARENKYH
jgi:hypothetical protein